MHSTQDLLSLLKRIKNFTELEKELANISNDKEKGDLFELFCQVYLKVIYKKQAFKSIQLFKDIDTKTLEKLNLRLSKDYGIDIVAITDTDEIWTIQVKFRQSDQLTWTELSTFKASSEKANFTMLMSNVSKINHPHSVLTGFSSILRNEFEALTEEDFSNIKATLKGQAIKPIVFSPRPHQIEAINSAINHFKTNNLGQMIHACGTGKTLTSLWIKEELKPKNTIVYVPSLSLLKQTLEEWTKHKSSDFSIKCVCSDQSVSTTARELDETIVDVTELGVPVTTNSKEIVEFLKSSEKDKIIFSTYQSAPVILEAIKSLSNFSFDFGVYDEAHRTASKSEHLFTKSLNTPVQKKLFMTATPKLYAPHLKSRAKEEDILLCSMDDATIYGEIFHEIKFGEAIKLNLLSDYKIKVITVANDEIKELIDRRYWIDLLGKEITADELAKVWALLKSFNKANHVISFHSRISRAKEFQSLVEKTIELLKNHKKETEDVKIYHISGEYPTYQRSKILSEFIAQKKSLVTNARCLTEGVDVPAIDGVYFVDPKQNIIDIVQAVGRAIRKKLTRYGYIIIPVFIKEDTNAEKIIESSAFKQVWDVVEAMKDQDARLSHIIEELQELKGKKRFGSLKSREQAEERALKTDLGNIFDLSDSILPKNIDILEFVEQISVKTLDIVGQSWDERFGEYKAFKEKERREPARPRDSKNELEDKLADWVGIQRTWRKRGKLLKERIEKLNSVNFIWDQLDDWWNQSVNDYISFKEKNNREPSNSSKIKSEKLIAKWTNKTRVTYKINKLSKDRVDQLNSIGFLWDPFETVWNQTFDEYRSFKNKHSREPSDKSKIKPEKLLARWVAKQRGQYNRDKLSENRKSKLNSVGFIWTPHESMWANSFQEYKKFKEKMGREPTNKSKNEIEDELAQWASIQRQNFKRNQLSKDRINLLKSIGFVWDLLDTEWNQSFQKYKSFKETVGKEPSSTSKDETERFLATWCSTQRGTYLKNKISKERIGKLNSINFVWDQKSYLWEQAFQEYSSFKEKNNIEPSQDKRVGRWVNTQRQHKKKNKLSSERIDKLNSIGFMWSLKKGDWEQQFKEYKLFSEKYNGKTTEASKNKSEKLLKVWASRQRIAYKKKELSQDRISKLNSINFIWEPNDFSWFESFNAYKKFKEDFEKEPSSISQKDHEKRLGIWVLNQRLRYKLKRIPKDRLDKLKAIGFHWTIKLQDHSTKQH
jgi:superfamily II DNA or RNA helicase